MPAFPGSAKLKAAKIRSTVTYLLVAGLFGTAGWVLFGQSEDSQSSISELSEDQLARDIANGLGAVGVNSSAAGGQNPDVASHSSEDSIEVVTSDEPLEIDASLIRDDQVQKASAESPSSTSGPLFGDPISDVDPNSPIDPNAVGRQADPSQPSSSVSQGRPAWLTGKIEFD